MKRTLALLTALAFALLPALAPAAVAENRDEGTVRLRENKKRASLETATISMANAEGVKVDLVGAIHIADKKYYDRLNKRFKRYDAVLFELVGGDGNVVEHLKQEPDKNNAIRFFQVLLKNALKLEFQIDAIDYSAENFIHADMSTEEFEESSGGMGQSFQDLFQRAFKAQADAATGEDDDPLSDMGSIFGMFDGTASTDETKLTLARQLQHMEKLIAAIEGDDGTVILTGRNKVAIDKIVEVVGAGKKDLALFYGAAHLPGIEQELSEKHGFKRTGVTWQKAWKITKTPPPAEQPATEAP